MNWKLTQKAIDQPKIDDWSVWQIADPKQVNILDDIYDDLAAQGRVTGVIKLRPGVYLAHGGSWLF